jgi:hypothetical protein
MFENYQDRESFQRETVMGVISGRAIDYGLDLSSNLEFINSSLGRIYANNDDIGDSCLARFSAQ